MEADIYCLPSTMNRYGVFALEYPHEHTASKARRPHVGGILVGRYYYEGIRLARDYIPSGGP